ncbi:vitelline membrane protein Vm26Aa-like [Calliphora vicina]|uniref:vitelline membrane protein Vm26Aa-like n=1 Tax=Calliphora vicina TaxID=7373 RepID=UPI00325BC69D
MNFFICFALITAIAAVSAASTTTGTTSTNTNVNTATKQDSLDTDTQSIQSLLNTDYSRFRKSAGYGAASIPAPPCPKNYLFSCQPNLAPIPCAAPAASYGSAGAYTAPVPTYVAPVGNNYGLPQTYSGFLPQSMNQWYQY